MHVEYANRKYIASLLLISLHHSIQVKHEERLTFLAVPLALGDPGPDQWRNFQQAQIPSEG